MRAKLHQLLIQELLRVHCAITGVTRVPIQDDVLPLSKPIVGTSGRVYTELPVPKGTAITSSVIGYNLSVFVYAHNSHHFSRALISIYLCGRNQDLWGPDAYEFRPERWFEMNEKVDSPVGVYGNLYGLSCSSGAAVEVLTSQSPSYTFSGGTRTCIGWRFACVDSLSNHSLFAEKFKIAFMIVSSRCKHSW